MAIGTVLIGLVWFGMVSVLWYGFWPYLTLASVFKGPAAAAALEPGPHYKVEIVD